MRNQPSNSSTLTAPVKDVDASPPPRFAPITTRLKASIALLSRVAYGREQEWRSLKRRLFSAGVATCAMGGAFLAAIAVQAVPPSAVFVVVGALLTVGGTMAFVVSLIIDLTEVFHPTVPAVVVGGVASRYVSRYADPSDLPGLHDLYRRYFSDVAATEVMATWQRRCRDAFTIVQRISRESAWSSRLQTVGSFKLLPLNCDGVKAIESGEATGSTLRPEHICSKGERPAAFYLGDVVGRGLARGVVVGQLIATRSRLPNGTLIYARPLTADGCRIMTSEGFVKVSDGWSEPEIGSLCKLEVKSNNHRRRR